MFPADTNVPPRSAPGIIQSSFGSLAWKVYRGWWVFAETRMKGRAIVRRRRERRTFIIIFFAGPVFVEH